MVPLPICVTLVVFCPGVGVEVTCFTGFVEVATGVDVAVDGTSSKGIVVVAVGITERVVSGAGTKNAPSDTAAALSEFTAVGTKRAE